MTASFQTVPEEILPDALINHASLEQVDQLLVLKHLPINLERLEIRKQKLLKQSNKNPNIGGSLK